MRPEILTVKTANFEMDYFSFGEGKRTMVIIPGLALHSATGSAHAVAAAYAPFCKDYTCYLFDRKKDLPSVYTLREAARDTAEALRALGLKDIYLFGTSMGGMIAQYLAAEPDLVKKAVFASTMCRSNDTATRVLGNWAELAKNRQVVALNRDCVRKVYSEEYVKKYAAAFKVLETLGTEEELDRFAVLATAVTEFDATDVLSKVTCPVLVTGAGKDEVLTGAAAEELAERLHVVPYMYPEGSHAVYDEDPDYKARMLCFFNGTEE